MSILYLLRDKHAGSQFNFQFCFKENYHLLKFDNWTLKTYIRIKKIPLSILLPDLIFPVYKIDREHSDKNVSKERMKIPNRYSEAF